MSSNEGEVLEGSDDKTCQESSKSSHIRKKCVRSVITKEKK